MLEFEARKRSPLLIDITTLDEVIKHNTVAYNVDSTRVLGDIEHIDYNPAHYKHHTPRPQLYLLDLGRWALKIKPQWSIVRLLTEQYHVSLFADMKDGLKRRPMWLGSYSSRPSAMPLEAGSFPHHVLGTLTRSVLLLPGGEEGKHRRGRARVLSQHPGVPVYSDRHWRQSSKRMTPCTVQGDTYSKAHVRNVDCRNRDDSPGGVSSRPGDLWQLPALRNPLLFCVMRRKLREWAFVRDD